VLDANCLVLWLWLQLIEVKPMKGNKSSASAALVVGNKLQLKMAMAYT